MDNNHLMIVADTGGGKSLTLANLIEGIEDAQFIEFDFQVGGSGEMIAKQMDKPIVHEVLGTDLCLRMNLAPKCEDEKELMVAIQMHASAVGAYRGMGDTHTKVLTMESFYPYVRIKFDTGYRFADLAHCWYQETNRKLIAEVDDPVGLRWLLDAPKMHSYAARDRHPAKRFADVLSMPAIAERDCGQSDIAEIFNSGNNIVVTANHKVIHDEFSFYMNYRILEIIRLKVLGEIKTDIVIIIEESEILGLAPMIARMLMGVRKYGIAFWIVAQTGKWNDTEFQTTEAIWGSTNRIIHRCSSPWLLDRLMKDLAGVFDPYFIKRTHRQLRQIINGSEFVDTESTTKRNKGGSSVTAGQREKNVYHRFIEERPEYMSLQEQQQLLRGAISGFPPGWGLSKINGEIDFVRFPLWTGKKREERQENGYESTPQPSSSWLRKTSSTQPKPQVEPSKDLPPESIFDPEDLF